LGASQRKVYHENKLNPVQKCFLVTLLQIRPPPFGEVDVVSSVCDVVEGVERGVAVSLKVVCARAALKGLVFGRGWNKNEVNKLFKLSV
jgi:hypothetical protein